MIPVKHWRQQKRTGRERKAGLEEGRLKGVYTLGQPLHWAADDLCSGDSFSHLALGVALTGPFRGPLQVREEWAEATEVGLRPVLPASLCCPLLVSATSLWLHK